MSKKNTAPKTEKHHIKKFNNILNVKDMRSVIIKMATVLFFLSLFVSLPSCSKDDEPNIFSSNSDIISFDIEGVETTVKILSNRKAILVAVPPQSSLSELIAVFELSSGAEAHLGGIMQYSGKSKNDFSKMLTYVVTAQDGKKSFWSIYVKDYVHEDLSSIGLGTFLGKKKSLDADYEWYIVQTNFSCGPSCVTMVSRWSDSTYTKSGYEVQSEIRPDGSGINGTSPEELFQYLQKQNIPVTTIIADNSKLQESLESGSIAIVALDMNRIRYLSNVAFRTDRFYATYVGWWHYIVIKGFIEVDEELFFEVYDSASRNDRFEDGSYKGKNRYYRGEDLNKARAAYWWGMQAMIISKKYE